MGAHQTQLDLLTRVLFGLLEAISSRALAIPASLSPGLVYEACRREDRNLLHARRLWRWYADKLGQRSGPPDSPRARTLRAADELTWSCWKTALTSLGVAKSDLPAAPIPYLAPQFAASATPRTDPPPDLRPGQKDDLLIRHVEKLPIPVIALPPACERRPWWLILAAHEASHHVQFESPGLQARTQEAVTDALGDDAGDWLPWCRELFADAAAVLLTGPAALWAIAELEMRDAPGLLIAPSGSYPPPLVRLAAARAVASQAGLPAQAQVFNVERPSDPELVKQGGPEERRDGWTERSDQRREPEGGDRWTERSDRGTRERSEGRGRAKPGGDRERRTRERSEGRGRAESAPEAERGLVFSRAGNGVTADGNARRLLASVPRVAGALLNLTAETGGKLRSLASTTVRGYDDGVIAGWEDQLLGLSEPIPEPGLAAARFCAAGSVTAWELVTEMGSGEAMDDAARRLAARVLTVLPDCREPGTRAAAAAPDAVALTRAILADLDAEAAP